MKTWDKVLKKVSHQSRGNRIKGYCLKCQASRRITNHTREYLSNGQPKIRGICIVCHSRIARLSKE